MICFIGKQPSWDLAIVRIPEEFSSSPSISQQTTPSNPQRSTSQHESIIQTSTPTEVSVSTFSAINGLPLSQSPKSSSQSAPCSPILIPTTHSSPKSHMSTKPIGRGTKPLQGNGLVNMQSSGHHRTHI